MFFEHIAEYERLYRALLGRKGSPWFVLKMRAFMMKLLKEYERLPIWETDQPLYPASDEFIPNLVATMMVEAIIWWLEQARRYTPQEMTRRCARLVTAISKETGTWE
jgi:hypothetical protein